MAVYLNAEAFKSFTKCICGRLRTVACHDNAADKKSDSSESVNKPENVKIVCNAKVASYLVLLNVGSIYDNNNFSLILELHEHFNLAVGCKAREDSRRMVIVEELAAEFKIELAAELVNSFSYMLRLHLNIFFVIKSDFFQHQHLKNCNIRFIIILTAFFFNKIC